LSIIKIAVNLPQRLDNINSWHQTVAKVILLIFIQGSKQIKLFFCKTSCSFLICRAQHTWIKDHIDPDLLSKVANDSMFLSSLFLSSPIGKSFVFSSSRYFSPLLLSLRELCLFKGSSPKSIMVLSFSLRYFPYISEIWIGNSGNQKFFVCIYGNGTIYSE